MDCVDDVWECASKPAGHYPHCTDCSKFVKCSGSALSSTVVTCPSSLFYDITFGVCNFQGLAVCG